MKISRRIFIAFTVLGALMATNQPDSQFDTLPFPGAGLSVKMSADVKEAAEYHLVVSMPGSGEETLPCSLTVRITQPQTEKVISDGTVTSISLGNEYGFGKYQSYEGGSWFLKPGEYYLDIQNRTNFSPAMTRGASVSLEEQMIGVTEKFLWNGIRHAIGIGFFWCGIIGLLWCEFKKHTATVMPHE